MTVSVIGLDIAKNTFQVHGVDEQGQRVVNRSLKRHQLRQWFATLDRAEDCVVGMEACGTCHYWARELEKLGYRPRIMKAAFVKPFRRGQKNDARDAEAICEAVQRPSMRFVPLKTVEQQAMLGLLQVRERLIRERTRLINQTRALLLEQGISIGLGRKRFRETLPDILEDGENDLPMLLRDTVADIYDDYRVLEGRIERLTRRIEAVARQDKVCQRLQALEGVGALTATLLRALIGDAKPFRCGRDFAAYLGLTPRQHSSGDKERLLSITKAGNGLLRRFLVHGARAALQRVGDKQDARSAWLQGLLRRRPHNVVVVALAAKNARIALAMVKGDSAYTPA
ncbi:IS110-like element ISPa11 family transposase [Marinobacter nanhaiticus D15-8W]|uniref:IS110 family transposase n=1 Tax=Marinobacter nanhaiticus D15-8W TaxID=626887 RepID=N6W2I4_9GAMM|nr:IS110 family transposase [Marinobacter nanhaiticus]ENO16735.1 IS110 family transposase [Marinobacter nanhaiticus D15-8W]BES72543.1 IS110-like element ISPa11 family transposase [Marinobacter nanhaiticus D15-8W]